MSPLLSSFGKGVMGLNPAIIFGLISGFYMHTVFTYIYVYIHMVPDIATYAEM